MNDLFEQGKKLLLNKVKKAVTIKIALFVGGALFFLFLVLMIIMMFTAPVLQALDAVDTFKAKVASIWSKFGNVLAGRGFIEINEEVLKEKEKEFTLKLNRHYQMYLNMADLEIDAPLILATIYYPMDTTYDSNTYNCINHIGSEEDVKKACEKSAIKTKENLFDYWDDKRKELSNIIRHSVVQITTTYECEAHTKVVTNEDGSQSTVTFYVQGDKIGEERETPFGGFWETIWQGENFPEESSFPEDEQCNSPSPIKKYTYERDVEGYDKYLKETYIPDTPEYLFPQDLSGENREDLLDQIVTNIHDLSELYYYLFDTVVAAEHIYGAIPYDLLQYLTVPIGVGIGTDGKNDYRITSCFQRRRQLSNGTVRAHTGIDLNTRSSDKNVRAAADGIVIRAVKTNNFNCYATGCVDGGGSGNNVKIRHEINGVVFYTLYLHLSTVSVDVGDEVEAGSIIGVIGNTGHSEAEHLHFQFNDSYDNPINPGNLFTNPYKISETSGCEALSTDCAVKNSSAAISPSYGLWNGQKYPIAVSVNGNSPIPLEQYILGVTLNESYSSFHIEALKAQMVAARTYTLGAQRYNRFTLENRQIVIDMGVASEATQTFNLNRICDLGAEAQNNMIQALNSTRGQVLLAFATNKMFSSEYSSCAENDGSQTLGDGYVWKLPEKVETVKAYCTRQVCNTGNGNTCGHGRGMSQVGSNVLARDYQYDYKVILSYYYNANIGNLADIYDLNVYEK